MAHVGTGTERDDAPVRQASLRSHNLGVVSRSVFASEQPISRARVAVKTGLTRSTVSRLAEELLTAGLIAERELPAERLRGRPAIPLGPAAGTIGGMGLEVNVDYVAGRVLDLTGAVVAEDLVAGDFESSDPGEVLPLLGALGRRLLQRADEADIPIAGSCLALPGLVDTGTGRLRLAPNLGWRELRPADYLGSGALPGHTELYVANEADLAGYAESMAAPGRQAAEGTFLYISGGIGVGSALVRDGRVTVGERGWAGEIGHATIEPAGPECHCGSQGCLERYAGLSAMVAASGLPRGTTATELAAAAREGGPARTAVERAGWALGIALANTINVVDLASVVLGAGYIPLFDLLEPGISAQLDRRVLSSTLEGTAVRPAESTVATAATGGATWALQRVLTAPAEWITSLAVPAG